MFNHRLFDIYFEPDYGKTHEKIENGHCEIFEYESIYGKVYHMFIKRVIPLKVNNSLWYDIITPYGYGGPLIIESTVDKKILVEEFNKSFCKYCYDNNIVSEFIRFHPICGNALDFYDIYDVIHIRNTVGTNLAFYNDPFQEEFSKSCRKKIQKSLKEGVSYKVTFNPSDITNFKRFYYSTMDRNKAEAYYYFDDEYFNKCVKLLGRNLVLIEAIFKEKVIAMGVYFVYDKTIHIHLSGTLNEYLYLSPAYILRYAVMEWGKKNGYELIHHGGGRSNNPNDSLFLFKKRFGKSTEFKFYVGKRIWNKEVYIKICEIAGVSEDLEFFPAYRKR